MSNSSNGAAFYSQETKHLAEPEKNEALELCSVRSAKSSKDLCWGIDQWSQWRQLAHDVKQYTLAHLDELLTEFTDKLATKGVTILWARDAKEANEIIIGIAKENNVKTVVKGKSMVSEELDLNHAFAAEGIDALETDLGEFIVQLSGRRPTHIVTPATHLSAEDVGHLFSEKLGVPFTAEHETLTMIARKTLRQKFVSADMGISGVNFGIADTGTCCLVENEGNIGLSTSAPRIHVAIMGIEKLLPSIDYLPLFLNMLPRIATGQKLTSYTHLFCGPTEGRKMYLVLVDNGRTKALAQSEYRKVLQCIRCGFCMNNCPVYRQAGGWAYGWVYPGPLGAILTPQLLGIEKAGKLPFASSLCGACSQNCPVKVDIAHQLIRLRHKAVREKSPARSLLDRLTWTGFALAMKSAWRYRLLMRGIKLGMVFVPFLPIHPWLLGKWTRGRALPRRPKEGSFRKWWKQNRERQN